MEFLNKKCILHISDPWDFGTINGCGPFEVEIIDSFTIKNDDTLILFTSQNFYFNEINFNYLAITSRHARDTLKDLFIKKRIAINITALVIKKYSIIKVKDILENDLSKIFLIGDIELK